MVRITDKQIEAMAFTIQYSENVGTAFIMDDEAIERVKEAIAIVGVDTGIEWSISVMRKAVELQSEILNKSNKMSSKKDIKKYEKKLSDLLDNLVFFTSGVTNNEYITREDFENDFKQLVDTPFMYFLNISRDTDNSVADEMLKEFLDYDHSAKGAFKMIETQINKYHLGRTLDYIDNNVRGV